MTDTITAPDGTRFPRKFSWPLRIFLCLYLGDMVIRSLISLQPVSDWREDYGLESYPLSLPTWKELEQAAQGEDPDGYASSGERLAASFKALGPYFSPIPDEETASLLETPEDCWRYSLCWVGTRLTFFGRVLAVDQEWPMFSPNVGMDDTVARARLIFEDDEVREVYLLAEPEPVTSYFRWKVWQKRELEVETMASHDYDARMGLSNMLSYRYPENAAGSPLQQIEYYHITYTYPSPWEDPNEVLGRQEDPTPDMVEPVFWTYDVQTRKGRYAKD